jgi:hypothetical protein
LGTNYQSAVPSARIGFLFIKIDPAIQNGHPRRSLKCSCCCGLRVSRWGSLAGQSVRGPRADASAGAPPEADVSWFLI